MSFFDNVEYAYTFDDAYLVPRYSEMESRSDISLESEVVSGVKINHPIIPANMDTITGVPMLIEMDNLGGIGIFHRYIREEGIIEAVNEIKKHKKLNYAISVGTKSDEVKMFINHFTSKGCPFPKFVVIDVAHGNMSLVKDTIRMIKLEYGLPVMAGNICNWNAAENMAVWGADAVKVGIGPGSICSTRTTTGCGFPQLSAVKEVAEALKGSGIKIIADGGIKNSGDMVKALAAGAHAVMVGSLFAGTEETPGDSIFIGKDRYKAYNGMASKESQSSFFEVPEDKIISEGVASQVSYKGKIEPIYMELSGGIRHGLSYLGCRNLVELRVAGGKFESWVMISESSVAEGRPHIFERK